MSVSVNSRLKTTSIVFIVINTLLVFFLSGMPKTDHQYHDTWILPHYVHYVVLRDLEITQYSHIVDGNEVSVNGEPLLVAKGTIVGGSATILSYPFTVRLSTGENESYSFEVNEGDIVMSAEDRAKFDEYEEHNRMVAERADSNRKRLWIFDADHPEYFSNIVTGAVHAVIFALIALLIIPKKTSKRIPAKTHYIIFIVINGILSVWLMYGIIYFLLNPIHCM